MAVVLSPADLTINNVCRIKYEDMVDAVREYMQNCPRTPRVENHGDMFSRSFSALEAAAFVDDVCSWGGRLGLLVGRRVIAMNTNASLACTLKAAVAQNDVEKAIRTIAGVRGLATSFGSKHLRMLNPDRFVVLDGLLSKNLKYTLDPGGYRAINKDCAEVAIKLTGLGIPNPVDDAYIKNALVNPRKNKMQWWPADVEIALFAEVKRWSQKATWMAAHGDNTGLAVGVHRAVPVKALRSQEISPAVDSGAHNFRGFWDWLAVKQEVDTLCGGSRIQGHAKNDILELVTRQRKTKFTITRQTTCNYCTDVFWSEFAAVQLQGNRRYVAALLLEYLNT